MLHSLIDNIIINKTATPELPGEFAGGFGRGGGGGRVGAVQAFAGEGGLGGGAGGVLEGGAEVADGAGAFFGGALGVERAEVGERSFSRS